VAGRGWLALAEMRWTPPTWQVRFGWEVANSPAGLSTSTYYYYFLGYIINNYYLVLFIYLFQVLYLK
jgi:hypothetical protein